MLPKLDFEKTRKGTVDFIRDYLGDKKAIIGISGGLDSTAVAYLSAEALGNENVFGIMMPEDSRISDEDFKYAQHVTKNLEIQYRIASIDPTINEFKKILPELDKIALGNIKARARMTVLYAYANQYDGMVMGTTNKSELLTGYYTKYGDGGVDLEPIAGMYKTQEREFARKLEVPEKIIERVPTAALWEGQTDEGELGISYEELDEILYSLYDLKLDPEEVSKKHDSEKVKYFIDLVERTEHKRKLPPSIGVYYEDPNIR